MDIPYIEDHNWVTAMLEVEADKMNSIEVYYSKDNVLPDLLLHCTPKEL